MFEIEFSESAYDDLYHLKKFEQGLIHSRKGVCAMRTLNVSTDLPSVEELLEFASEDNVILRTPEGREFIPAAIDDFDREVELVRQNQELMAFLEQRSQEKKTFTLSEVREKPGLP